MDFQTFLKEKYEPLIAKVESLEKKLSVEKDGNHCFYSFLNLIERERLLNKICDLEDNIEHLTETIKKMQNKVNLVNNCSYN